MGMKVVASLGHIQGTELLNDFASKGHFTKRTISTSCAECLRVQNILPRLS